MSEYKTAIVAAISALVVVVGWNVAFAPQDGAPGKNAFGALSGPDIPSNYLQWGGVRVENYSTSALNSATTTPMAIQSPAATSTLSLGSGCHFEVSSTTAKAVRFAKATSPNATTTFLFGANIAANAKGSIAATTTTDNFVFAPNNWLVMSMVGGTGVDSPTAECVASFLVF